uniref:Genome polyprotein n=1 Tax=Traubia modesta potyvirus TaxID=2933149 RepID=A0A9C7GX28_9POTV|nr:polyprotein [Traubia modesta potyvirus]CAI5383969.1 polyprotein [Traubia modesta potyvirus]
MAAISNVFTLGSFTFNIPTIVKREVEQITMNKPPKTQRDAVSVLDEWAAKYAEKRCVTCITKEGEAALRKKYMYELALAKAKLARKEKEVQELEFRAAPPTIVDKILVVEDTPRGGEEVKQKVTLNRSPSRKVKKQNKPTRMNEDQFNCFLKTVKKIASNKLMNVEIITKRRVSLKYGIWKGRLSAVIRTAHMEKRKSRIDLRLDDWQSTALKELVKTNNFGATVDCKDLKPGDSGIVLNPHRMVGHFGRSWEGYFIVRGNYEGKIFDARSKVTHTTLKHMVQYSHANNFWEGFNEKWAIYRAHTDHACSPTYSVRDCGKVTALIAQCIIPSFKMTCGVCASEYFQTTDEELCTMLYKKSVEGLEILAMEYPTFANVRRFLDILKNLTEPISDTTETFNEVFRTIGDKQHSPFKHLNILNEFFIRGRNNNKHQWDGARESLLELARFQKNRTDNIKKGDISTFRNKLSGKANYNLYLSCDNQLDKNANFQWGQREYHARRFFSNFFVEVDPVKGYASYEMRKHPGGARKLAIGNLIVPLDLAEFRRRMKGEYVKQPSTSKQCTSTKDGNFVYPCCCTTLDDGSPVESALYSPTKKHLVVGNSGDSKYVDLPKGETEMLYISKDGYCYINIYLAMLVNVREDEAKDFTKKVRDIFVPKLGEWPTVLDVATTCAQLRIFYPDVHDAELPRILVDHNTQTCHVVDSFGSITTGYHILKASTVSQFVLFANDELESDIKHYRVGGRILTPPPLDADDLRDLRLYKNHHVPIMREYDAIKLLVKGIFRPKVMHELLMDEPYIMLLSLISPGILLAMFNSGAFESAIKLWVNKKQNVAIIATLLASLAKKISVADTLMQQLQIMEASSQDFLDHTIDGFKLYSTYIVSVNFLHRLKSKSQSDASLAENGFINNQGAIASLMEKSYLELLEESWNALTWREKLSASWHSRKQRLSLTSFLRPRKTADLKGMYSTSLSAVFTEGVNHCKSSIHQGLKRARAYVDEKCVSVSSHLLRRIINTLPGVFNLINSLFVISGLLSVLYSIQCIVHEHEKYKLYKYNKELEKKIASCEEIYAQLTKKLGKQPTWEEYLAYVDIVNADLKQLLTYNMEPNEVSHQKSTEDIKSMEHIIAFVALVIMMFDVERSDCVFKTLNKFKGLVGTMNSEVRHQSLDDIVETFDTRNQIINFELQDDVFQNSSTCETTFEQWWNNQVERGNTIPHYRTEGYFFEFTRATAPKIASEVGLSSKTDFLIRGAVGSGKSTGLPFHLSSLGRVLLVEPTRPLTENVFKQLASEPFFLKPTMRMRGSSIFGSSPVTVMTSGFALHYYANNVNQLQEYDFIIIDECHVMDASAMALRSLVHAFHKSCKVLKVSATPPGREVEFKTQKAVTLITEETLTHDDLVRSLGSGGNADVLKHGHNILIYVASYNEVDSLSKLLTDKKMMVTKIDGRTMKHGSSEIVTKGSSSAPHFIVATNIIENGVTLDIDVVVDFGTKVSPFLDIDNRSIAYNKVNISYGERIQRLGRVGRFQKGTALKIGKTETGLIEIPSLISTEAALYCFAYNLPVMTSSVSTSLLGKCTVRQVRTMHQFELSPFFSYNFVAHDGSMHPVIYDTLKKFKLRDSVTALCEKSIPYRASSSWMTAREYERIGVRLDIPADTKVAFHAKDLPPRIHEELWKTIEEHKGTTVLPTIRASSVSKIAYTLSTEVHAIPRTLALLEKLSEEEKIKQSQFRSLIDNGFSSSFSIVGIANALRSRYARDYTGDNIRKIETVASQLKEFHNLNASNDDVNLIARFEALQYVHHQSVGSLAQALKLRGIWNKSLLAKDILIAGGVAIGGFWMMYKWFMDSISKVRHQGRAKSKRIQALKFRKSRDKRAGFEIDNNEDTIEEFFGSAYTKKGKGRGTTVGMGKSSRRFINMYGFEPGEYSYIRFVDPLTGAVIQENIHADIVDIQNQFGEIRKQKILDDELEPQQTYLENTINAYFIKDWSNKALKVDLTPHMPLKICKTNGIAKFPEREGELRQTGAPVEVNLEDIPKMEVEHEAKALLRGLRDYNPVAQTICKLTASSENGTCSTFGIGFGALIIANHHLFKSFNGSLEIKSHHGLFRVPNMMNLQVKPIKGRDIIIIKLPKDFPVFPQRLHFRAPVNSERIIIVGSNFQEKHISATITETSTTHSVPRSSFWKHWITTDDGHCGLPVVSTADGMILGIHSLANNRNSENYYTDFGEDFESSILRSQEHIEWTKNWKYNPDNVVWGPLKLTESTPGGMFKTTKIIEDLFAYGNEQVREQGENSAWMLAALKENLMAVAYMKSQLVTKHVVKGECMYFKQFLKIDEQASKYFEPRMWAYGKSLLNRDAYIKDLMKYSKPIEIGIVNCDAFEEAVNRVILYLAMKGFHKCNWITDENEIFNALNMKAAVGALYGGKKKEYFKDYSSADKEQIIKESCFRLYTGKLGIWNGSLKAELRSKEKIQANKTRTFTAAPLDTLLGGKVCVDDFNNQFYSKNIDCCWTVGMTKFYGGWNKLLNKLPDDWIYCDADGSQFDSSLTPYLINAVLAIRSTYMEDWDIGFQMLQNLYTEIIYTPISTPDGTIVKKFRGNNSGQPSTVVDNSLMVILAMHYALVREGVMFENFEDCCKFFVNGDDLLIAVNPTHESLLDNFGKHFSELGLNYEFSSRTRNKSELWFMSHRGLKVDGMYIPKLEEERIVSILQWDRANLPEHRLEAICAAMIESWGYPDLIHQIRRFYQWLIEQEPFSELASEGKAPYISSLALRKLYLNENVESGELEAYLATFADLDDEFECGSYDVHHQSSEEIQALDAGGSNNQPKKQSDKLSNKDPANQNVGDRDVNAGTTGTFNIPRIKSITSKMRMPRSKGTAVLNLAHLLEYEPEQINLSNARSTQSQFDTWYASVKDAYDIASDEDMSTIMNGLMVWCIENGTSPNINGVWVMMDGDEQVEYPLKPVVENAQPTFRQIMAHFSDVAEAYIQMRNKKKPYMPRYGLLRNLRDMSLARYAFDFYEVTSHTPSRAREAHIQMKAAALKSAQSRMFGLDGGISTQEENTERHTTEDVSPNMHTLLGVRNM